MAHTVLALIIQTWMNGLIWVYFIMRPKVIYIIIELYIYFCIIWILKFKKYFSNICSFI